MYEVEFVIDESQIRRVFDAARQSTDGINFGLITGGVWNAVGEMPMPPAGFNPTYDQGARGPTPRVATFVPERVTINFPAFIVEDDEVATRHFLDVNVVRFLERAYRAAAKRPDLIPQAQIGIKLRGLLEENEPEGENVANASNLYSFVQEYPDVLVVYAGGNQTNYVVTFDALRRPLQTTVERYAGGPATGP